MGNAAQSSSIHLVSKAFLPHYRSVNSVAVLTRYMQRQDIGVATLLASSGINPGDLDDPDFFVTPEQELKVIRNIVKLAPEPAIGLEIGQHYHVGVYGKQGAAAYSCDTLLEAIQIAYRYIVLSLTFFQHDLKVEGELAYMQMNELLDLKDLRMFVCERDVASMQRMARDLLGKPLPFQEVRFAYPQPDYASAYEQAFECPVRFNAGANLIVFESQYLFMPLPLANPLVKKTFEDECRQVSLRLQEMETASGRIRHTLMHQHGTLPSFTQMARSMNVSPRTLRRRLSEEGASYKSLVAEIMCEKAIDLIEKTSDSFEQIAMELGYSDLPNFYRAFKSWTGHNPGYYRKRKD